MTFCPDFCQLSHCHLLLFLGNLMFSTLINPSLYKSTPFTLFLVPQYPGSCGIHVIPPHLLPFIKCMVPFPGSSLVQVKSLGPGTWDLGPGTNPLDFTCLCPQGTIIISTLTGTPLCLGPHRFLLKHV